jgi:uncharacterized RDD family membrane protein YckC
MSQEHYPGVFDRVISISIDGIIIIAFMFGASYIFSLFEGVPDWLRIGAFIFIFLLYDPLFTSIFGGTVGHMIVGLRVKQASDETKNIIFPLAILRYIVKAGLGMISLFTVYGNPNRKAIHDYLVGSVVIYAKSKENQNQE